MICRDIRNFTLTGLVTSAIFLMGHTAEAQVELRVGRILSALMGPPPAFVPPTLPRGSVAPLPVRYAPSWQTHSSGLLTRELFCNRTGKCVLLAVQRPSDPRFVYYLDPACNQYVAISTTRHHAARCERSGGAIFLDPRGQQIPAPPVIPNFPGNATIPVPPDLDIPALPQAPSLPTRYRLRL